MAKETFVCPSCDGEGTLSYKQNDTRFEFELLFCPFCGSDLDRDVEPELDFEEEQNRQSTQTVSFQSRAGRKTSLIWPPRRINYCGTVLACYYDGSLTWE